MITIPTGTDLSGLLLGLIVCSIVFVLLLVLSLALEQYSKLLSYVLAVPALAGLVAAVVIMIVGNSIHDADLDNQQRAVVKEMQQQYALTISNDQSASLLDNHQITLNDGTHVKLRFNHNRHHAKLVVVRETPYPEATR